MEDSDLHSDPEPSWLAEFAQTILLIVVSITTVLVVACGIQIFRDVLEAITHIFP